MGNKKAPIKLLWCAILRSQVDDACAILNKMGGCVVLNMLGYRTKTKIVADLFGLGDYECSVLVAIIPSNRSVQILEELNKKFEWDTNLGSAITTPIGAISRNTLMGFYDIQKQIATILQEKEQNKLKEDKAEQIQENNTSKEVQQ